MTSLLKDVLSGDEIHALTEVGFLASAAGDTARASAIFGALVRVRPSRAFPYIGLAMAWLNAGRPNEAVEVFENAAAIEEAELPDMTLYHALALQQARRSGESQRLLQRIDLRAASDVARRLIQSMRSDVYRTTRDVSYDKLAHDSVLLSEIPCSKG